MRFPVPSDVHQHPPAEMALKERVGHLGYTLNKHQGSKRTICTDVLVLQPHQCAVQVKVWGFCPSLGHLLPSGGSGCHFCPGDGLGLLWNSKGQRLFLAGAEVHIWARDGRVETRGRLLLAGMLPSGLKSLSSPWGLGSCANGNEGAADPNVPTPTKPWAGAEEAPNERLLPAVPIPGAGVLCPKVGVDVPPNTGLLSGVLPTLKAKGELWLVVPRVF